MSRSRREPWFTDGYKGSKRRQYNKRYANHVVRHTEDVPNGKAYKKLYGSYDICDFRFRYDPRPRVYFSWAKNALVVLEPTPSWQVCRK